MSDATEQERTEEALEEIGVRTMDEIHLPGDEEAAQEAEAAEPTPEPQGSAEEPQVAPEGEPEAPAEEAAGEAEEEPTSILETVRAKWQKQAGTPAEPQDANALELAQLRQQAQQRHEQEQADLREKLADLEAKVAGKDEPARPSVDEGRQARIDAATKFYQERFNLREDEAREMAVSTAEQARIEAELKTKEALAPIEEWRTQAEEGQKQQEQIQQSSKGLAKGLVDLAKAGGTELELVQDFQQNGFRSFLGAALGQLAGGDAGKLTEILSMPGSASLVEQAGAALARRTEAYANSTTTQTADSIGSTGLGTRTSPRSKGAAKPTPKSSPNAQVAAELDAELGGAEASFPFLAGDFKWDSP